MGASQKAALAHMRDAARGLPIAAAMVTEFKALPLSATLNDAIDLLLSTSQHEFPVVDAAGRVQGILTRDMLLAALRQDGLQTPVRKALQG